MSLVEEGDVSDLAIGVLNPSLDRVKGGLSERWLLGRFRGGFLWTGGFGFGLCRGLLDWLLVLSRHPLPDCVVDLVGAEMVCVDLVLLDALEVSIFGAQQADELVRGLEAGQAVVLLLHETAHELRQVLPDQLLLLVGQLLHEKGWRRC